MRTPSVRTSVVAVALAVHPLAHAAAQCSPTVQKLVTDQKYDEAKAELNAALRKNEHDDAAMECMGRISINQENIKDAIDWMEKAVKGNDQSSSHHLWLANALGEQASHTSKIKLPFLARRIKSEFDRAAQLDPTSIDAKHGLIEFYSQAPGVMGGSMDKAKEQAREIEKLNAWRGHYEMARLLEGDKDVAGAEKEFQAAVTAAPDTAATHLFLGSFYRRQKRWDAAMTTYDNLLKRKPDLINTRLTIAYTLNQANQNVERAEHETRTWLASPPSDAPKNNFSIAHYLLGQFAEKQGKKDVAKAEYQQALTFLPANNDAKKALESLK